MHHRRHDECKLHIAGGQHIAFLHDAYFGRFFKMEELIQHRANLCVAHDRGIGIAQHQFIHCGGVIRLHMVDYQIIQLAPAQHVRDVFKELAGNGTIHGIHHQRFFIIDEIAVVGYAGRDGIYVFKQGKTAILTADPGDFIGNFSRAIHTRNSFLNDLAWLF